MLALVVHFVWSALHPIAARSRTLWQVRVVPRGDLRHRICQTAHASLTATCNRLIHRVMIITSYPQDAEPYHRGSTGLPCFHLVLAQRRRSVSQRPACTSSDGGSLYLARHSGPGRRARLVEPDRGSAAVEGAATFRPYRHADGARKPSSTPRNPVGPPRGQDGFAHQRPGSRRTRNTPALARPSLRPQRAGTLYDANPRPAGPEPSEARRHDGTGAASRFR